MMLRNVIMKGLHQLRDAAEDPAPNPLRGQVAEEAYHQIEPGATGGHEVHVKPAVSLDPPLDLGMLLGGIVVLDEMERLVLRRLLINQPQERQPFLMAMPGQAGGEDFALGQLERGEALSPASHRLATGAKQDRDVVGVSSFGCHEHDLCSQDEPGWRAAPAGPARQLAPLLVTEFNVGGNTRGHLLLSPARTTIS